jgi:hypothetical protein
LSFIFSHLARRVPWLSLAVWLALLGAQEAVGAEPEATLTFVRGGVVVSGPEAARGRDFRVNGRPAPSEALPGGDGRLVEADWAPRAALDVSWRPTPAGPERPARISGRAPLRPVPWPWRVLSWPPAGSLAGAPDTASALAFSADGRLLALGSEQGRLAVYAQDGPARLQAFRPGRYIKHLAFDPAGGRLYAGEQGAEGRLAAYDVPAGPAPGDARPVWTFDSAADLGRSPPPEPGDPYGWVNQPGAYRVLAVGGDVLAAFTRGWTEGGRRQARARLYRLDGATGALRWAYPGGGALPYALTWFSVDERARRVALPVQLPAGAVPAPGEVSRVEVLDAASGRVIFAAPIPAVPPYALTAFWRGVALRPDGAALAAAAEDGRGWLWRSLPGPSAPAHAPTDLQLLQLVRPLVLGNTTLTATNGALAVTAQAAIFATGATYVPLEFGGGESAIAHPQGNRLFAHDWSGQPRWVWPLENDLQGLETAAGVLAVALGGERPQPAAAFQGLVLLRPGAAGDRLIYRYPLAGRAVYGALALSPDGHWAALAEAPRFASGDPRPRGAARVHWLR